MSTHNRRSPKPATEQPGNSFRYLYWRLDDAQFQQLCATILRLKYDPVACYPVRMADGGIDAIAEGSIVYQVKWSSKLLQNPASWLDNAISGEREKIKSLVAKKNIQKYVLITSVAGTTTSDEAGSTQKLAARLEAYSDEFGIPVECWWQAELDAEVVAAPDEVKWGFQEMLAGSDAIRYLIYGAEGAGAAARMREVALQVLATQAGEDSKIKFSQADMDQAQLADLFIDVQSSVESNPRRMPTGYRAASATIGTVDRLRKVEFPFTFLLGVPGQGKSTLGQYLCQLHRWSILTSDTDDLGEANASPLSDPLLPFRIDLTDYATWLSGRDPFDDSEPATQARTRGKRRRSIETFLADFCSVKSGGRSVTTDDVHGLLERFPTLTVFDGLDEVADIDLRRIIVEEINEFARRLGKNRQATRRFQVLVTARPNASRLPEPDDEMFQVIRLEPLSAILQSEYVNKWCDARGLDDLHRNRLRRVFRDRTSLEHVARLADNPMQLTILLYLISKKGDAVPVTRTPLYSDYMATLLDREVDRKQIDRDSVPDVEEVTAFLGWHMHSGVEELPTAGRMLSKDIVTTLMVYFRQVGRDESVSDKLFRAASDRFWALTSNVDGTFEFAVQPVREYFAARFLAEWAARDWKIPLAKQAVLRELMARPYWLNTLRFYAGFASPNELAGLRYGIEDGLTLDGPRLQVRSAAWTLLSDGVFVPNRPVQRDVVTLLTDDLTTMLMAGRPAADFPALADTVGGEEFVRQSLQAIENNPAAATSAVRLQMLHDRMKWPRESFQAWWEGALLGAVQSSSETAWLALGAAYGAAIAPDGVLGSSQLDSLDNRRSMMRMVSAGEPDPAVVRRLMQAVLEGETSELRPAGTSRPSELLRALRPQWFLVDGTEDRLQRFGHLAVTMTNKAARNSAWKKLEAFDKRYADVRLATRKGQRGQAGTTEPWQATARALTEIHGPSWLAAEIALSAAARDDLSASGSIERDSVPFGPASDYGRLVMDIRRQRDPRWWRDMYDGFADDLSRQTLVLALIAVVHADLTTQLLDLVDGTIKRLSADHFIRIANSSSRLAIGGGARTLSPRFAAVSGLDPRTRLLLAHYLEISDLDPLQAVTDTQLDEIASPEPASWPVARSLGMRMQSSANEALFTAASRLSATGSPAWIAFDDVIPAAVADHVLTNPGQFPASWTELAERSKSTGWSDPPLATLARSAGWIPDVPHFHQTVGPAPD